jgi:hypothetical protein
MMGSQLRATAWILNSVITRPFLAWRGIPLQAQRAMYLPDWRSLEAPPPTRSSSREAPSSEGNPYTDGQ